MKSPSLTTLIKRRQADDFVGRQAQLDTFESNIGLPVEQRSFIFNIFGQGGVGKSYLLRRFRALAEKRQCATALTDETTLDIPIVLNRLAEQLRSSTREFSDFFDRYEHYRKKRNELAADPEFPPSILAGSARGIARAGVKLARRAPGLGVVFDFVDEDTVAEQASEWATFLARKLNNKDDVLLLREPAAVLTPLFLRGLDALATAEATVLQFDTYERTAPHLDPWLRALFDGQFGDVAPNIVVCIAGQYELDHVRWAPFRGVMCTLPLSEFSTEEAREFLARKQIVDSHRITSILEASGRLPVLLATLADAAQRGDDMRDESLTAIERFLKWIDDPALRQLAIDAALPRRLDRDVLAVLAPDRPADSSLDWLRHLPFVRDASKYHDLVRAQMLKHKHRLYPSSWSGLHNTLAEYHRNRRDKHLMDGGSNRDNLWMASTAEAAYHELCAVGDSGSRKALQLFFSAFTHTIEFGRLLASTIESAAIDAESTELRWSQAVIDQFLSAWSEKRYSDAMIPYKIILSATESTEHHKHALYWYAVMLASAYRPSSAVAELDRALGMTDASADSRRFRFRALRARSASLRVLNRLEDALHDLKDAISLFPDSHRARLEYGRLLRELGQTDEALIQFRSALLTPGDAHRIEKECALTYASAGRFHEAAAAAERALASYPACGDCWGILVRALRRFESPDAVYERLQKITASRALDYGVLLARGSALQHLGHTEDALADFTSAMEAAPDVARPRHYRGKLLAKLGRHQEARADFDMAVAIDSSVRLARGQFFLATGNFELALADFEAARHRDSTRHEAESGAAESLLRMNRAAEAAETVARALSAWAECEHCWKIYGEAVLQLAGPRYFEQMLRELPLTGDAGDPARIAAARGIAMKSLQFFDLAVAELSYAIDHGVIDLGVLTSRSDAYHAIGQHAEAAADLKAAIEMEANPSDRYNELGLLLTYASRYEEAIEAYQMAVGFVEDYIVAYNIAVAAIRWRGSLAAKDEIENAERALSRCVAQDVAGAAEYGFAGLACVTGQHSEALSRLENAIRLMPSVRVWAKKDVAWLELRENPEFISLVHT